MTRCQRQSRLGIGAEFESSDECTALVPATLLDNSGAQRAAFRPVPQAAVNDVHCTYIVTANRHLTDPNNSLAGSATTNDVAAAEQANCWRSEWSFWPGYRFLVKVSGNLHPTVAKEVEVNLQNLLSRTMKILGNGMKRMKNFIRPKRETVKSVENYLKQDLKPSLKRYRRESHCDLLVIGRRLRGFVDCVLVRELGMD
ncbi:FAD oxidoreductase [Culex quinquefasciatus]|uniref:FAD oxidoreductase n=1 Tax=Culex quinquefasciatus TaxID=7176 RepID=B0X623_CULQU|nr:FAD oxidoreductase [Culex quinquefasciatus]|eukprot:XP_001865095.1 FAD oxidoreductase [Culex quinquefasciatus]